MVFSIKFLLLSEFVSGVQLLILVGSINIIVNLIALNNILPMKGKKKGKYETPL